MEAGQVMSAMRMQVMTSIEFKQKEAEPSTPPGKACTQ
jgi:hypothetical protein